MATKRTRKPRRHTQSGPALHAVDTSTKGVDRAMTKLRALEAERRAADRRITLLTSRIEAQRQLLLRMLSEAPTIVTAPRGGAADGDA